VEPGAWQNLFNGKDLAGWRLATVPDPGSRIEEQQGWAVCGGAEPAPEDPSRFALRAGTGVLYNGKAGRTANLVCEREHDDCELHVEFVVPRGSNSGVYLMGRYEIQVLDSWGAEELRYGTCGGIYARRVAGEDVDGTPPRVNASRPPGVWQSYDILFRAPRFDSSGGKTQNAIFLRVTWNGTVVHEQVEVRGPTRAALFADERPTGPLMLQGDHGPVAYRNLRLRPAAGRP
jgi:hypothetical protein